MYKEIFEALKTKYLGVSENILDRVAKNLAKTVKTAEEVTTAVEGVTFQQILDSYGDSRATDATKTAVANYERKHGLKDGKPVEQPKPQESVENVVIDENTPAYVKNLLESMKALTEKVSTMEGERLTVNRKQKLEEVLQGLPEINRKGYERIDLSGMKEEEFNTFLSEVTAEVGEIAKGQVVKGAVFGKPTVAGSTVQQQPSVQEASKEEVDAVMSHMKI